MPRLYNQVYQPYTYEDFIKPMQDSTEAHKEVEKEYNANMLVVESLRQRAENELENNPDSQWANRILQYANKLEGYASDLARNGLTSNIKNNVMDMYRGFGTDVVPVTKAIEREKELQKIIDNTDPKTRTLYGKRPSLDQIIADPNISQTRYSGKDIYDLSKAQAAAFAARNTQVIQPRNISEYMYEYGKKKGFTQNEIYNILNNDPALAQIFGQIKQSYGYGSDDTLSESDKTRLDNEILLGALEGLIPEIDMKYSTRPDLKYDDDNYTSGSTSGTGTGTGNGSLIKRPGVHFENSVTPRQQRSNNLLRDRLVNDKNVVTGQSMSENGKTRYRISEDYVNNLITSVNKQKYKKRIEAEGDLVYDVYYDMNGNEIDVPFYKKQAEQIGITEKDSYSTALEKINRYLTDGASYEDMADATSNAAIAVYLRNEDYETAKNKYLVNGTYEVEKVNGKWQRKGNNKFDTTGYEPFRVDVGNAGIVQVWKKTKSTDNEKPSDDDIVFTEYYNRQRGDQIYNSLQKGVVDVENARRRKIDDLLFQQMATGTMNYDDQKLYEFTGFNKAQIDQMIANFKGSYEDKMSMLEFLCQIEIKYLNGELEEARNILQNNPQSMDAKMAYDTAEIRLKTAVKNIRTMNDIVDLIDQNANNIPHLVMDDLGLEYGKKPAIYD